MIRSAAFTWRSRMRNCSMNTLRSSWLKLVVLVMTLIWPWIRFSVVVLLVSNPSRAAGVVPVRIPLAVSAGRMAAWSAADSIAQSVSVRVIRLMGRVPLPTSTK
jgi:hypothetical protein